jgi:hypothetical protein
MSFRQRTTPTRPRNRFLLAGAATLCLAFGGQAVAAHGAAPPDPVVPTTTRSAVENTVESYFALQDTSWKRTGPAPTVAELTTPGFSAAASDRLTDLDEVVATLAEDGIVADSVSVSTTLTSLSVHGTEATGIASVITRITWAPSVGVPPSAAEVDYTVTLSQHGAAWKVADARAVDLAPDLAADGDAPPTDTIDLGPPSSTDRSNRPGNLPPKTTAPETEGTSTTGRTGATASSTDRRKVPPGTDYQKMADYAIYWSKPERKNTDFHSYDNDCTNFVSQALHAGGWPGSGGTNFLNYKDDHRWAHDVGNVFKYLDTYSWVSAKHLANYTVLSERTDPLIYLWDGQVGDILFTDWDPDNTPDGTIDHAMMVTSRTHGEPFISQHSNWRSNIPLSLEIHYALEAGKPFIVWYGRVT